MGPFLLLFISSVNALVQIPENFPPHSPPSILTNFTEISSLNPGLFNSSNSLVYGCYNYCNMPHVRPHEYSIPSRDYTLEYVEVIHRHHKRTPYASNLFPREDLELFCNSKDFYYAEPKNTSAAGLYWKNYKDPENPFAHAGYNGSCQFPQISEGGLDDAYIHGKDIAATYRDLLHFLPDQIDPHLIQLYATNNVITSHTLSQVIRGLFPNSEGPHVINVQQALSDYLEPIYECLASSEMKRAITSQDQWKRHLRLSLDLFARLDANSGVLPQSAGWHTSVDHYFDNLSHRTCHNLPLPAGILFSDAQSIFQIGHYEYNYLYRVAPQLTLYSGTVYGVYLKKLRQHLRERINNETAVIYRHATAHDGSLAPLLGALQIDGLFWPGMGAEVVFELWKKDSDHYIRVLYGGVPLKTNSEMGTLDLVDVRVFDQYLANITEALKLCQN